jgi:polyisoprenyl-phosphate glycosyltransferase
VRPTVAISIVIPVYEEEAVLPELFRELNRVRELLRQAYGPTEVVLVDDGSKDQSWPMIAAQCEQDPGLVGLKLSRNFGHQSALAAGLEMARGEAVVTMDADLQDPPEVILRMMEAHRRGYDVVYATRVDRGTETWLKRVTARGFYFLMEKISGVAMPRNTGDFRLLSRRALSELCRLRESHRFLRGLVPWIGFPQTQVFYDRSPRAAGATHYPLHKMVLLAFDGITSLSTIPLRLAYAVSLGLFAIFFGYVIRVLYVHFILHGELIPGWTSLMAAITIFGTIQLLLLGIFGEYLGRIYEQVKQRPLYIVQEIRNAETPGAPSQPLRPGPPNPPDSSLQE